MTEPSVEQLVRAHIAALAALHYSPGSRVEMDSFSRTCDRSYGDDNNAHPDGECPNPDCIDGNEYVSAAREMDDLLRAWLPNENQHLVAWLRVGPKLRDVLEEHVRLWGPDQDMPDFHDAIVRAEAVLAEVKKAGL